MVKFVIGLRNIAIFYRRISLVLLIYKYVYLEQVSFYITTGKTINLI